MLDIILTIPMWIINIINAVRPPIGVEIHELCFSEITNNPMHDIFVLTAHPLRIYCDISFTNRKSVPIYVKQVSLQIDGTLLKESGDIQNMRLESAERRSMQIIFPVNDEFTPREVMPFVLYANPTVGRRSIIKGTLPLIHMDS